MKFIPLSEPVIAANEWKYAKGCLDSGWVSSSGPFVGKFEKGVIDYVGADFGIACVNGTSGLQMALQVSGVSDGDEVLVPTVTFIAPINAIRYCKAEPVFMDCDNFLNLNTAKTEEFIKENCRSTKRGLINKKSGRLIKAILPVHVFGNPCDMEEVMRLGRLYGLMVIEDASESIGAYYTKGKYAGKYTGTIGDFGVYSFNGNKIVTSGSGGMIITRYKNKAKEIKYLINQAKDDTVRYVHNRVGYNFAMNSIQAAVGLAQLERLPDFIAIKKRNYLTYCSALSGIAGLSMLGYPDGTSPNFWFYSLLIDKNGFGCDREELMQALALKNIQTRPLWVLNHLQKPYLRNQGYRISFAYGFWEDVLNLPCSVNLREKDILFICKQIIKMRRPL